MCGQSQIGQARDSSWNQIHAKGMCWEKLEGVGKQQQRRSRHPGILIEAKRFVGLTCLDQMWETNACKRWPCKTTGCHSWGFASLPRVQGCMTSMTSLHNNLLEATHGSLQLRAQPIVPCCTPCALMC